MGVHPHSRRAFGRAASRVVRVAATAIACALIAPLPASAGPDTAKTTEDKAIAAFLGLCLPAVAGGNDIAQVAHKRKLPQVPAEESDVYLQGKSGTAFELPEVGRGAVLALASPTCSVMLDKVDAREFLQQATYWFGTDHSPFRLTANKTLVSGDIQREYRADMDGKPVVMRLFLRLQPIPGGTQAMLTAAGAE